MMLLAGDGGVWTSFYMDPFNFQDLNLGLGNFSSSSRTLHRLLLVAALWSTSGQACPSVQVKTSVYQSPVPLIVKSSGVVADVKYFSGSWQYIAFFFLHLCIAHLASESNSSSPCIAGRAWSFEVFAHLSPKGWGGSRTAFMGKGLSLTQWNVFSEHDRLSTP